MAEILQTTFPNVFSVTDTVCIYEILLKFLPMGPIGSFVQATPHKIYVLCGVGSGNGVSPNRMGYYCFSNQGGHLGAISI